MNILLITIIVIVFLLIYLVAVNIEKFDTDTTSSLKKCPFFYQFGDTSENSILQFVDKERQNKEYLKNSKSGSAASDIVVDLKQCFDDCKLTKYDYNLLKCKEYNSCNKVFDFTKIKDKKLNIFKSTWANKENFDYKNYKDSNYEDCIINCNKTDCSKEICKIKCEQVKKCNFDPTREFRHIYDCIQSCENSKRNDGSICSDAINDRDYCKKVCTDCGDRCGYKNQCSNTVNFNGIKIKNDVVFSRDGTKAKVYWCIDKTIITTPVDFVLVLKTNNLDDGDKINKVKGSWETNYEFILKNLTPDLEYKLTIIHQDPETEQIKSSNELIFTPKKKKINSMYLLDSIAEDNKPNIAASYNYCNI